MDSKHGTLFVVATPIGNLQDLTLRALEVLKSVDGILCEDTRHTAKLLAAFGVRNKTRRLDAHASDRDLEKVVVKLLDGEDWAIVSDAGTPGVSDPGAFLVRWAVREKIKLVPVPGASAVLTLLSVAGSLHRSFVFRGFFPRKKGEREEECRVFLQSDTALGIWLESPLRIQETVSEVARYMPNSRFVVAKELTKLHERLFYCDASEVESLITQELNREGKKGEWIFAVERDDRDRIDTGTELWTKTLKSFLNLGISPSRAAKEVAGLFGVNRQMVYRQSLDWAEKNNTST